MGRYERTHERLQSAALELFLERGYDATTTAAVADRAGVTEMTLFRHFPSKELLLLADPFDPKIAAAVRDRPADEPAIRAAAEGIRASWRDLPAEAIAGLRARLRIIAEAKDLHAALERNSRGTMIKIAEALTDRGVAEGTARVVAAAAISGLSVALLDWARNGTDDLRDALDHALDALSGRS